MSDIISALQSKRQELVEAVKMLEREIAGYRAGIVHLEATIRLFDPEENAAVSVPSASRARSAWFRQKECSRLIYDVLRGAADPMTTRDVADRLAEVKGIALADSKERALFTKTVLGSLNRTTGVERVIVESAIAWRAV